ncbi:transposase [Clostridium disporicum]|uniref:transposase n=1 Tax=Clostridium disporicum TaxID=84024 RepID=UPI00361DA628
MCPEGNRLYLITRKKDSKIKEYNNSEVCNRCSNKSKCTKAKNGKVIRRNESSQSVDNMILRLETCKDKYSLRKSIVEHPFGTLKRNMNFTYLLLRNFKNVRGEISIAFFTYNLKRVIKILGVKGILESLYTVILLTIFNNVNLYRKVYA